MIRRDGLVQITDFGLAQIVDSPEFSDASPSNLLMGTYQYMSPEQIQGRDSISGATFSR